MRELLLLSVVATIHGSALPGEDQLLTLLPACGNRSASNGFVCFQQVGEVRARLQLWCSRSKRRNASARTHTGLDFLGGHAGRAGRRCPT